MFLKNNIKLRIISSLANSQFLQTQHYYLKLVYDNPSQFDEASRELILLNYELWFKFLRRIEKFFILNNGLVHKKFIEMEYYTTFTELIEVVRLNTNIFNIAGDYLILLKRSTNSLFVPISKLFDENVSCEDIYSTLTYFINLYIQNVIHIIHEFQNFTNNNEPPFLSITDFCLELLKYEIYPIIDRADVYKQFFNIDSFNIKKYIEQEIPQEYLDKLKDRDFKILTIQ